MQGAVEQFSALYDDTKCTVEFFFEASPLIVSVEQVRLHCYDSAEFAHLFDAKEWAEGLFYGKDIFVLANKLSIPQHSQWLCVLSVRVVSVSDLPDSIDGLASLTTDSSTSCVVQRSFLTLLTIAPDEDLAKRGIYCLHGVIPSSSSQAKASQASFPVSGHADGGGYEIPPMQDYAALLLEHSSQILARNLPTK